MFTDWLDLIFNIWNTDFGVNMYGISVFAIVLALFLRLLGARKC